MRAVEVISDPRINPGGNKLCSEPIYNTYNGMHIRYMLVSTMLIILRAAHNPQHHLRDIDIDKNRRLKIFQNFEFQH